MLACMMCLRCIYLLIGERHFLAEMQRGKNWIEEHDLTRGREGEETERRGEGGGGERGEGDRDREGERY